MTRKRCPSCGKTKAASDFGRNQTLGDGLSFYCLECNRAKSNAHYRKRRGEMGMPVRDHSWIPDGFRWCPDCKKPVSHENYLRNSASPSGFGSSCKPCHRAASNEAYWKRAYGLTKEQVDQLRADQGDECAICGAKSPQHLDHDHSTGNIRRLLCQRCNHGLGLFRDEPYLLRVAALYVEGHRQQHALAVLEEAMRNGPEGARPPGNPPVGSQRRPGTRSTSSRGTGHTGRSRSQQQPGEAEH